MSAWTATFDCLTVPLAAGNRGAFLRWSRPATPELYAQARASYARQQMISEFEEETWRQRRFRYGSRTTGADGVSSFDGAGGVAAGPSSWCWPNVASYLPNQPDMSGPDGNGLMGSVIVPVSGETHFNIQIMQK